MQEQGVEFDDANKVRQRWQESFEGGFSDVDEEMQDAVAVAQEQIRENGGFQELVEATGVSDEAIVFAPSLANAEGGNVNFMELAQAERKGGVSMVYSIPNGTKSTTPQTPRAGDTVSSNDVASILRHEMAHDMWDEGSREFRQWFNSEYRDLPEGAITSYADERAEEGFTELVAISTNPEYDESEFSDEVTELAAEVKERVASEDFGVEPEDVTPDLPGPSLSATDVSEGDTVGVMETDSGDVRTGEVVDILPRENDSPLVEVDVGGGSTTLAGDGEDGPRRLFQPE
jgi:hypothetical protein